MSLKTVWGENFFFLSGTQFFSFKPSKNWMRPIHGRGFLNGSGVKNSPAVQEIWVQSLDWEDPLEEGMASHSSILAWRILMDRSLAGYSPWIHKELDMTERLSTQHKPPYIESLSFSNTSLLSFLSQGFLCTCYSLLETVSLPFLK